MISLEEAIAITKAHFEPQGKKDILRVYEAPDFWLTYAGKKGAIQYGGYGLMINKNDGSIKYFYMQDNGSYELFQQTKEVAFENYLSLE